MAKAATEENQKNNNPSWIGQRFGKFTVIEITKGYSEKDKDIRNAAWIWVIKCDCGKVCKGQPSVVRAEKMQLHCRSCAARKRKEHLAPITGDRFGNLTVIGRSSGKLWKYRCDCGSIVEDDLGYIRKTSIPGCDLYLPERRSLSSIKHGGAANGRKNRLYHIWAGMKNRCSRKELPDFKYWGGKGITVCHEWHDFANFSNWSLSNGYMDGLSIDRINSYGNYEPKNCEWVTKSENSRRASAGKFRKISEFEDEIMDLKKKLASSESWDNVEWDSMIMAMVA